MKVMFADNGYPTYIVDRIIKQLTCIKTALPQGDNDEIDTEIKPVFLKLPWIGNSSTVFGIEIG